MSAQATTRAAEAPEVSVKVAQHVLWYFGDTGLGVQPGDFTQRLLRAFASADEENFTKLSGSFPDYGHAFSSVSRTAWGLEWLRKKALQTKTVEAPINAVMSVLDPTGKLAAAVNHRNTPGSITELAENEVFVFGSNAQGNHFGGGARFAFDNFGAIWGQGEGHHGQTYAIPTMGTEEELAEAVGRFLYYAATNRELVFFVTKIGTGIAGRKITDVAPLFADCAPNVILPREFEEAIA
jgi:hypothetical protein